MKIKSLSSCLLSILLVSVLVITLGGCYRPGGPVPESPKPPAWQVWTPEQVNALVMMEEVAIHSPAPRDNGIPPEHADYINVLRYRLRDSHPDPSQADAVLVLMPGFICGANGFDYLARQMVYMAKRTRGLDLEVWATERRPNCLEDMTGLVAAEESGDVGVAIDYYFNGAPVDGRVFEGFLESEEAPYLSEFGLELFMRDIYTTITTLVPDPEVRREKVFIGGHSLGGIATGFFAGWDFDGDPATTEDAGYRNCAGLVALDSYIDVTPETFQTTRDSLVKITDDPRLAAVDEDSYRETLEKLRNGTLDRILAIPGMTPTTMVILELLGMEANWAPEDESTIFGRLPALEDVDLITRVIHSRALDDFILGIPKITDFRYTNEALLGVVLDDNYMPLTIIQSSMGFLAGGAVVRKDFPLPHQIADLPLIIELLGGALSKTPLYIANDAGPSYLDLGTGPLYSWVNFDEVGRWWDPDFQDTEGEVTYTQVREEVSDIQDVARILYSGPSNLTEWYFTIRLTADLTAALEPYGPEYGLAFLHGDHVDDLPRIELLAENGPSRSMFGFEPPEGLPVIEGYNHLDVITAAADRPFHRRNDVIWRLLGFMTDPGE